MRPTHVVSLAVALVLGCFATPGLAAAEIGAPAPAFSGIGSDGRSISLSDFRGKTVVLEWTNNECPFVHKHYRSGNMQALQREATSQGAVWLSIISSAPGKQGYVDGASAEALSERRGAMPTAVVLDSSGAIGRAYDAKTTPHMFIIDADGVLVFAGGIDDHPSTDIADIPKAHNYVRAALTQVFSGSAVEPAVTRPYGCSIKY